MERKQLLLCPSFIAHVKQRRLRSITSWQWNKVLAAKCECAPVYKAKVDKYKPLHHRISWCIMLDLKRERNGCISRTLMTKSRIRIFRLHVRLGFFPLFFSTFPLFPPSFSRVAFPQCWGLSQTIKSTRAATSLFLAFSTSNTKALHRTPTINWLQPKLLLPYSSLFTTYSISLYSDTWEIKMFFWNYRLF